MGEMYFGLAAATFEWKFGNHKGDFSYRQHSRGAGLSKYVGSLGVEEVPSNIGWLVVFGVCGKAVVDCCSLCLAGGLCLVGCFGGIWLLDKRSEFINLCRHQSKLLLKSLNRNDSMD